MDGDDRESLSNHRASPGPSRLSYADTTCFEISAAVTRSQHRADPCRQRSTAWQQTKRDRIAVPINRSQQRGIINAGSLLVNANVTSQIDVKLQLHSDETRGAMRECRIPPP